MTIGQFLLPEFDEEMKNTRELLERVDDKQWNWKPHAKSGTVGWLAAHIAAMVDWIPFTLQSEELDYAPVNGPSYEPPKIENRQQLLAELDKNIPKARAALANATDAEMRKNWTLLASGQKIFTMPRVACIRSMVMNHIIHHRAQLTVYYRLLGIPVPGLYGPSSGETEPTAAGA